MLLTVAKVGEAIFQVSIGPDPVSVPIRTIDHNDPTKVVSGGFGQHCWEGGDSLGGNGQP